MSDLPSKYDVTPRELAKGRNLKIGAVTAPLVLTVIPFVVTIFLLFFAVASPPAGVTVLFLGLIITFIGFITGLILSGTFAYRHSKWKAETRERIAADGIKAEEIEWFKKELRPAEKKALRELTRNDLLLADAYRETLASRLTATRILKSSKREMLLSQRRQAKLRLLKSENASQFQTEIQKDLEKLTTINTESKLMLAEAESRLQMIEAAALRGAGLADSELALKKLSARAADLPLALEEAKMANEIREEIEKGEVGEPVDTRQ